MSPIHPLDPLTAEEIRTAAGIIRAQPDVTDRWRFASIDLKEPSKKALADREHAPRVKPRSCAGTATTAPRSRASFRSMTSAWSAGTDWRRVTTPR